MKDIPNMLTLAGLCCGVLAIYFALLQNFQASVVAMLWAVLFDWYDGVVARRISGRSDAAKTFGSNMDALVDLITMCVCPAIILLSYGGYSLWFFPGALIVIASGVVRFSYFNIFGVDDDGTIKGLSNDIVALLVALIFVLEGVLSHNAFVALLYAVILVLSYLHVAPFRMRKMVGRWYHVITAYVLVMTVVYVFII
jgi:CDP-diacylglycerol--serine O-phosphatidyltransferase